MTTPPTWLVPHDFSELASRALDLARQMLAQEGGGRLLLVHVHAPTSEGLGLDLALVGGVNLERDAVTRASERLDALAASRRTGSVTIETRVLRGAPARAIAAFAEEQQCDLVVMGSHGRRGLARLVLGSVAESVVKQAGCSVLVVKGE